MPEVNEGVKEVLDEMEKDGVGVPKEPPKEPEKKEEKEPEKELKKEEEKEEEKEEKEELIPRSTPEGVQPWELRRLEKGLSKQMGELAASIKELASKPATPAREERTEELGDKLAEIKKIAEDAGLDPEPLTKVAEAILKAARPSPELIERLETSEKKESDRKYWEKQNELFGKEFDKTKELDAFKEDFGKLTAAETQEVKQKLNKLAFSDKYSGYALSDLLTLKKDELLPEKRRTAESGRGGMQRSKGSVDLSGKTVLSAEEQKDLTDAEFETYSENLAKEHKAPLRRGGQIV